MQRLRRETVDLHNGEFCVDVSTYGAVTFEATPREKCDTTFQKQCGVEMNYVRLYYKWAPHYLVNISYVGVWFEMKVMKNQCNEV